MSSKVHCRLRSLRQEWRLKQDDLACLLPVHRRNRVSCVEQGKRPPDAQEILAYSLIFGLPAGEIFPSFVEAVEEAVMQRAYRVRRSLEQHGSAAARVQCELADQIKARAITNARERGL